MSLSTLFLSTSDNVLAEPEPKLNFLILFMFRGCSQATWYEFQKTDMKVTRRPNKKPLCAVSDQIPFKFTFLAIFQQRASELGAGGDGGGKKPSPNPRPRDQELARRLAMNPNNKP